jgi:hypothetical protein
MILENAIKEAQEKYFSNCVTDADYMEAVMMYYKENMSLVRLAMNGTKHELGVINAKYMSHTDDTHIAAWANDIKKLFVRKKVLKTNDFNPLEYLAITYIAGSHGSNNWAKL